MKAPQICRWLTALLFGLLVVNVTAQAQTVVYAGRGLNQQGAFMYSWRPDGTVTVHTFGGRTEGRYKQVGDLRLVHLDPPLSREYEGPGQTCPWETVLYRHEVRVMTVKRTAGTDERGESEHRASTTTTTLTGCDAGDKTHSSLLSSVAFRTSHLDERLLPSMTDVVPGTVIAGPSEEQYGSHPYIADDVVALLPGEVQFLRTGAKHRTTMINGWFVLQLPWGERAYRRFSVDPETHAESWIEAGWAQGVPTSVDEALMVQLAPGAGFGTVEEVSRRWSSGLFTDHRHPLYFDLYPDGSGVKRGGPYSPHLGPFTWAFNGVNIEQVRNTGITRYDRTWIPLRNVGSGIRFVMESEIETKLSDGSSYELIKPRVNFLVDQGPAPPP